MKDDIYIKLIRFFHGPFRTAIANAYGIEDTLENKDEIKRLIKEKFKVDSMSDLTAVEIGEVITEIARITAIERGVMLPFPGEPDNIDELSMAEFLRLKK